MLSFNGFKKPLQEPLKCNISVLVGVIFSYNLRNLNTVFHFFLLYLNVKWHVLECTGQLCYALVIAQEPIYQCNISFSADFHFKYLIII